MNSFLSLFSQSNKSEQTDYESIYSDTDLNQYRNSMIENYGDIHLDFSQQISIASQRKSLKDADPRVKTIRFRIIEQNQDKQFKTSVDLVQKRCIEIIFKDRFKDLKKQICFFYSTEDLFEILQSLPNVSNFLPINPSHLQSVLLSTQKSNKALKPTYYITKTDEYEYHGQMSKSPEGSGIFYYENGNIYSGQVKSGKRHGFGIMIYSDGSKYEGHWNSDQRHGDGKYCGSNGDIFDGNFYNNYKEGAGILLSKKGYKLIANWKLDALEGQSTMTTANGKKISISWSRGVIQNQSNLSA